MERQDRHRFVQQYVERQKAYLPTYTAVDHLLNEPHGTPSKSLRSDEFGFETPVLRPRVPENVKAAQSQPAVQVGRSKSRTHGAEPGALQNQVPIPPPARLGEASSEIQHPALGKKDNSRSKRKKASTPIDTDNERAARLADRRERKRKKRAIVNPPQKHDEDIVPTTASQKGRANGQKAKKPAALALLYGFSATNVTKDRLTLRPAPSLGVFSKGRASAKKKVTATGKYSSRNELFSESAFLNKPSERAADHSKIDDDSDDSSVSLISNQPIPQAKCTTDRTKKDRGKCTEAPAAKASQESTRTAAESEVWDIELQSKLPSSARDVSSEPGGKDSAPVVLDLRGAEWGASTNVAGEHPERRNKTRSPGLSVTRSQSGHSVVCSSPLAISNKRDELNVPHAADAPSIHPSHSASQVGGRAADTQPSGLPLVASKYFIEPKPAPDQEFAADSLQTSRSNDGIDVPGSQVPGRDTEDAALDVQIIHRVASPINSLISVPQPMVDFQTWYDIAPLEFPSDVSPYDDCYARVDVPWEPLVGTCRGYFESSAVEDQGDRSTSATEHCHPHQCTTWDWYHSADLAIDDIEGVPVDDFEGSEDPLALECDDFGARGSGFEPCYFETQPEYYDPGEGQLSEQWFCMAETGQDSSEYDEAVDGSICYSEESLRDGELGEDVPGFLEGRALLQGVPERPRRVGLPGLVQAEMDVASRLRDHWRPLRL